jgi:gas vesicle protein
MSRGSSNLIAFIAGMAAGAALGILFAPDEGKNTRDKLSYQLSTYREKLVANIKQLRNGTTDTMTSAKAEGQKVVSEAQNKAEELMGEIDSLLHQIRSQS